MIVLLSPAKTIQFEKYYTQLQPSVPVFEKEAAELANILEQKSVAELQSLMKISEKLAVLNFDRYKVFAQNHNSKKSKPAILAFMGDVYEGMEAWTFTDKQMLEAQKRICILSGLYGVLKPLDLIQAHRLEMGTSLKLNEYKDLYEYWRTKITDVIIDSLNLYKTDVILNLASNEYSKVVNFDNIEAKLVSPAFKNHRNNEYKIVSFLAKKARGLMTSFVIKNNIKDVNDLVGFDLGGYYFNQEFSTESIPVFTSEF